jgi:hypothetical protein
MIFAEHPNRNTKNDLTSISRGTKAAAMTLVAAVIIPLLGACTGSSHPSERSSTSNSSFLLLSNGSPSIQFPPTYTRSYLPIIPHQNGIYLGETDKVRYWIMAERPVDGKCTSAFETAANSSDVNKVKLPEVVLASHKGQIEKLKRDTCKDGDELIGPVWQTLRPRT